MVATWANVGHDLVVESDHELPAFQALVDELGLVRAKGLVQLRSLPLPTLWQATQVLGLAGVTGQSPSAIESLLRQAVGGLGGGQLGSAAEYSFGLVSGTRDWPAQDRRAYSARIYGVSVERFRKHHERVVIEQVAEQIVVMCEERVRWGTKAQGFHGTSVLTAKAIVEDGFKISRNKFDWLGDGYEVRVGLVVGDVGALAPTIYTKINYLHRLGSSCRVTGAEQPPAAAPSPSAVAAACRSPLPPPVKRVPTIALPNVSRAGRAIYAMRTPR